MHRSLLRGGNSLLNRRSTLKPSQSIRHFRKGAPTKHTENKQVSGLAGVVEADNATFTTKVYHWTNLGLLCLTPLALFLSPSSVSVPVDFALGLIFPIHAHIGMNNVISDYVPKSTQKLARVAWLGATGIMFLGLLRVNIEGPGITETIKTIWRENPKKKYD